MKSTRQGNGRRQFIRQSAAGLGFLSLPSLLHPVGQSSKKKVVVVGGHPDDPESGAGGTIARLIRAGHEVTNMYFTNGDAGIAGKTHAEAAAIRRKESVEACKVLGAKPLFVNQVDGSSVITNEELARFEKLLLEEKPDLVFAQWPIDSHKDHQLSAVLTIQTWMRASEPFTLYFYEVCFGTQSMLFQPTDYVDITETRSIKMKALACHVSQDVVGADGKYSKGMTDCGHPSMEDFRGRALGVPAAEGFIRMTGRGMGELVV
ncbi:MAG TPA: PIG-L deacetylase family protein [Chryseosolibacter sp.]